MKHRSLFTLTILLLVAVLGTASLSAQAAYNESPMLAALVEAGELPPVEERLPVNPRVVEPFNEVGLTADRCASASRAATRAGAVSGISPDGKTSCHGHPISPVSSPTLPKAGK